MWSSTIFLNAIPITFARLFLLSICCKNLLMSPLYLIWYSSRRALTSSWVGPNRQINCSLNIFHWSYPSCLVYPSSPVIWFRYTIAKGVNVAPFFFPKGVLYPIAFFPPLQLVPVEIILTSGQPESDIFVGSIRKVMPQLCWSFGGFRNC